MRPLFTDGWNSMWHFIFGILAIYVPFIIPVFVLYQVIDWYDENMMIDLLEFFIGYVISYFIRILYDANGEMKVETKETKETVEIETKETVETKEIVEVETKETVEVETKEIELTKTENDLIA
jgi:hypothetical protein